MRDSHVEEFIASHRSELFSELKEEIADDRITDIETLTNKFLSLKQNSMYIIYGLHILIMEVIYPRRSLQRLLLIIYLFVLPTL